MQIHLLRLTCFSSLAFPFFHTHLIPSQTVHPSEVKIDLFATEIILYFHLPSVSSLVGGVSLVFTSCSFQAFFIYLLMWLPSLTTCEYSKPIQTSFSLSFQPVG